MPCVGWLFSFRGGGGRVPAPPPPSVAEFDKPSVSRNESTRVEVERFQVVFEVDMQPFAARTGRVCACDLDQAHAHAAPAGTNCDERVFDESVNESVPDDVDEPHEPEVITSDDPPQAVVAELAGPISVLDMLLEALSVQLADFIVGKRSSPLVADKTGIRTGQCGSLDRGHHRVALENAGETGGDFHHCSIRSLATSRCCVDSSTAARCAAKTIV